LGGCNCWRLNVTPITSLVDHVLSGHNLPNWTIRHILGPTSWASASILAIVVLWPPISLWGASECNMGPYLIPKRPLGMCQIWPNAVHPCYLYFRAIICPTSLPTPSPTDVTVQQDPPRPPTSLGGFTSATWGHI